MSQKPPLRALQTYNNQILPVRAARMCSRCHKPYSVCIIASPYGTGTLPDSFASVQGIYIPCSSLNKPPYSPILPLSFCFGKEALPPSPLIHLPGTSFKFFLKSFLFRRRSACMQNIVIFSNDMSCSVITFINRFSSTSLVDYSSHTS